MNTKTSDSCPSFAIEMTRGNYKALGPHPAFDGNEIILLRHGETIAEVFPDWVDRCQLSDNYYLPFDLNMPSQIPRRPEMRVACRVDPPLSEIGKITSQIVARELSERRAVPIRCIYSAPTLACLQTAAEVQSYLGNRCGLIKIDDRLASSTKNSKYWLTSEMRKGLSSRFDSDYASNVEPGRDFALIKEELKCMMRAIAQERGPVLIVGDSLTVKIMSDFGNGIYPRHELADIKQAIAIAEDAFTANASSVVKASRHKGQTYFEPSPIRLRPITAIGVDTSQNKDVDFSDL